MHKALETEPQEASHVDFPPRFSQEPGGQAKPGVHRGNILDETAEAIVVAIPAETTQRAYVGVAGQVFSAGGQDLKAQRDAFLQQFAGRTVLPPHTVFSLKVQGGRKLRCKHVICGVLPRTGPAEQHVEMLVTNALNEAARLGVRSLSLPVLGAGGFGFPVDQCASGTMKAINKFNPSRGPAQVRVVVFDESHMSVMQRELQRCFSPAAAIPRSAGFSQPNVTDAFTEYPPHFSQESGQRLTPEVHKGNILHETAEAIVVAVPADTTQRAYVGVAGQVFSAGGQDLLAQRNAFLRRYAGATALPPRTVFSLKVQGGGKLRCKHVICGVLPRDIGSAEQHVETLVANALKEAATLGVASVSLPVLGAGGFGFPVDQCASGTMKAINKFNPSRGRSPAQVRVVVFDQSHLSAMQRELQHCFLSAAAMPRSSGSSQSTAISRSANFTQSTGMSPSDELHLDLYGPNERAVSSASQDIQELVQSRHDSEQI